MKDKPMENLLPYLPSLQYSDPDFSASMRTLCLGLYFIMQLYFKVCHAVPAPENLTILSHNFNHILQWSPGLNSPPLTVFNIKQSCSPQEPPMQLNITNTAVDVSKALKDIYKSCTFYIWASLDNITSSKVQISFTPFEKTIIGPPVVFLSGCGDCLNISISLPKGSGKKTQLKHFYSSVSFNIKWKKAGEKQTNKVSTLNQEYVLPNLQPGDQYCVSVLPEINSNRNTRASDWQCEYTSKEEARGVAYIVGWSLGAALFGVGMLIVVVSLVYTGSLCKLKTTLPKILTNIMQTYNLIPEQTVIESVSLTDDQLMNKSKHYFTKKKAHRPLNEEQDLQNKEQEDEENYPHKMDTEDEEDYDEDEEENCSYMGHIFNNGGLECNNGEENSVSSHTEVASSVTMPSQHFHHNGINGSEELTLELAVERSGPPEFAEAQLVREGNEVGLGNGSRNVNLFSVTLRTLQPEEHVEDLNGEEVCKPLLPKEMKVLRQESDISLLERETQELLPDGTQMDRQLYAPVQTRIRTDILMTVGGQKDILPLCPFNLNKQTEEKSHSENKVTDTEKQHTQDTYLSEESDYCDTDYISR